MFERIRRIVSKKTREPSGSADVAREADDRTTGEEAQRARDTLAEETSAPGTPRLKSKNL